MSGHKNQNRVKDADLRRVLRETGAQPHEGFTALPPRSPRSLMSADEAREETRAYGWLIWRTFDIDPQGQFGPPKLKRTPYADDARGVLGSRHMGEDLGMSQSNASDALRRLVASGRARVDAEGRIYLRGDAPQPERIRRKKTSPLEPGELESFFCTEKIPQPLIERFQQLEPNRRSDFIRRYREMPEGFASHLKAKSPAERAYHTWLYLEADEYGDRLQADAIKAARAQDAANKARIVEAAGYQDSEQRGRKAVQKPLIVDLQVKVRFQEVFSVQKKSVQNSEAILYEIPADSEQKSSSLLSSSDVFQSGGEESAPPPTDAPTPPLELEQRVHQTLEEIGYPREPDDPIIRQFADLAAEHDLPGDVIVAAMRWKASQKRAKLWSPGGLFEMLSADLPRYIRVHQSVIDRERKLAASSEPRTHVRDIVDEIVALEREIEENPDRPDIAQLREKHAELLAIYRGDGKPVPAGGKT